MPQSRDFDALLAEALAHPLRGWDFSWMKDKGRYHDARPPWDYSALVLTLARTSPDLLDLGTGGGERLASFAPLPPRTVATESYPPNVRIAASRLSPLGGQVLHTWASPEAGLPFRDEAFHLVVDRNMGYSATEVARVLARGGTFLSEQTGGSEFPELYRLLGLQRPTHRDPPLNLAADTANLTDAGLQVSRSAETRWELVLDDVGALVWYLMAVPWAASAFSIDKHRDRLQRLHDGVFREGPVKIPRYGFWFEAKKR